MNSMQEKEIRTKRCTKCGKEKLLSSYYKATANRDGHRDQCKYCDGLYAKEYRKRKPEVLKACMQRYLDKNRGKMRERCRNWRQNNPEKARNATKNWLKRGNNKVFTCLRNRLYECGIRHRNKSIWDMLGYSSEEFCSHIEKKFRVGMTWNNHGKWEIDHIKPICSFAFTSHTDEEFKQCWSLNNLQPLWKHEHKVKGSKVA